MALATLRNIDDVQAVAPTATPAAYSEQDRRMVAEFDIQMLLPIGMTIVVFAIGVAYGLNVMEDVQDDQGATACPAAFPTYQAATKTCANSTGHTIQPTESVAFNATKSGVLAVSKFPAKLGLIVTVIIAAVVIGILVRYLFVRYG